MAGGPAGDASIAEDGAAYRSLFRSHPLPMLIFDVATFHILDVNAAAVRRYGYPREEFTSLSIREIRPVEDVPRLEKTVAEAGAGSYDAGEWRHRIADGTLIDVHVVTHPILFRGRQARLMSAEDITRRKQSESRLHLLGTALHAADNAIVITDRHGTIQWVNPAFTRMTGYEAAEALGSTHGELLRSGEHDAAFYADLWATVLDGRVWRGLMVNRRKGGTLYHEEQTITPVRDDGGTVSHFIAVKEDVTDRRAQEDRLRFQAQLLAAVGDAVIATDVTGRIEYWNGRAEEILGATADAVLGHDILDVTVPANRRAEAAALFERVLAGETWSGEFEVARRDGTSVPAFVTNSPIYDQRGRIVGVVGVSRDLTVERSLEHQLRHAQKMEAVGRLAGGIAHDFNNVLTAIHGHSQFLLDGLSDSTLLEDARVIHRSAERASQLTQQLLAFSRKQIRQPRVLDLGEAVRDVESLLRPIVGEDIILAISAPPGLGRIDADAGQLEQVVVNLAVNGRDAMPDGGVLGITIGRAEHTEVSDRVDDPVEPGPYMFIEVSDTGTGMDPDTVDRLFEPFFTTKAPGKGTGLGLSTVYGIVKQSGGHISVATRPGQGSAFRAFFPRVEGPLSAMPGSDPADPRPGTGQLVVVVEDEEGVRMLVRRVLEQAGYRAHDFATPQAALDAIGSGSEDVHIDLIITDVVMPGMSGIELAGRLVELQPQAAVIFMSGYAENDALHRALIDDRHRFIAKPFTPAELSALVADVLNLRP